MPERKCPCCGQLYPTASSELIDRDRAALEYLRRNPGIWGGPLERGQKHTDPDFCRWLENGWIEEWWRGKEPGYCLTEKGRAVLGGRA